jgi:hypothetical protein
VAESARRARTAEAGILSSTPSRLDPVSAWEVLRRISATLDRAGIVYMLAGSFASAYHGQIEDVVAILKLQWEALNRPYLERWISELSLNEEWSNAKRLAGISESA